MSVEIEQLTALRETLGKPSQAEISKVMQLGHPLVIQATFDEFNSRRQEVLQQQYELTEEIAAQEGTIPSRQALCVELLMAVGERIMINADLAAQKGSPSGFSFAFDACYGFSRGISRLMAVEPENVKEIDERILRLVSGKSNFEELTGSEAEEYFRIKKTTDDELGSIQKSFLQDPTGFLVFDDWVREIKEGRPISQNKVREYVLAGAELARDLYKLFYEIAGELYPPQRKD